MRALSLLILRALLRKKQWLAYQSLFTAEIFSITHFRQLYVHIESLHGRTEGDLNIEDLMASLEIAYQHESQKGMRAELEEVVMELQDVDEANEDLLEAQVREFVEKGLYHSCAEYILETIHGSKFDASRITALVERAVDVGTRVDSQVDDFHESPLSRTIDQGTVRVPLGFASQLDAHLNGGIGSGELTILLAPPARGKTSYLCWAGAYAAKRGRKVLHVTLEIRSEKVIRRYDQALTGLTAKGLEEAEWLVAAGREKVRQAGGEIWIKDWSYATVTANDIKALVRRMRSHGQAVDYVVVDYLELLSPVAQPRRNDVARHAYGNVGKECRAASVEMDVPLLSAWQVNRSGSEAHVLTAKDVSECWDIIKHSDTIVGLNQNLAQLAERRLVLNVIKMREGTSRRSYTVVSDLDRMVIRDRTLQDDGIVRDDDEVIQIGGKDGATNAADTKAEV